MGFGDFLDGIGVGRLKGVLSSRRGVVRAACGCHQGLRRTNNEDNFYFDGDYMQSDNHGLPEILVKEFGLEEDAFFAVYDGMGGMDYGEVASYTAAKLTRQFLADEGNVNPCDVTPSLEGLCQLLNRDVFQAGTDRGSEKVGSTLVGLYFHGGQVWDCNLGDSRGYQFRQGQMMRISVDHTDEEYVKEQGLNRKPWLTQYLGVDPEEMQIEPHIRSRYVQEGDVYLVCSDGITDMVSEQDICNILAAGRSPETCVEELVNAALEGGGKDNITAIVCMVGE